jgi:hypothetical protein
MLSVFAYSSSKSAQNQLYYLQHSMVGQAGQVEINLTECDILVGNFFVCIAFLKEVMDLFLVFLPLARNRMRQGLALLSMCAILCFVIDGRKIGCRKE